MQPDDATAMARAGAGDEEGFRRIVDRHGRAIYQLAYRLTGCRADAEDVVQETFVRAFRQIGSFESRSSIGTWLHRIGVNCAIDLIRRRRSWEIPDEAGAIEDRASDMHRPSAVALVEAREIRVGIDRAMAGLSPLERAAFVMRHFEESSIDDIAAALGLKNGAARHAVFRAVRKLRVALRGFTDGHHA